MTCKAPKHIYKVKIPAIETPSFQLGDRLDMLNPHMYISLLFGVVLLFMEACSIISILLAFERAQRRNKKVARKSDVTALLLRLSNICKSVKVTIVFLVFRPQ